MFNDLQTENKCQTQQSTVTAKLEFNVFSFNLVQVWEEVRFSPRNSAQRYGKRYDSVLELLHTGMGRGSSNKWYGKRYDSVREQHEAFVGFAKI